LAGEALAEPVAPDAQGRANEAVGARCERWLVNMFVVIVRRAGFRIAIVEVD